jgi:hypothetical protein
MSSASIARQALVSTFMGVDFIKYEGYEIIFETTDFKNIEQSFEITLELTKIASPTYTELEQI